MSVSLKQNVGNDNKVSHKVCQSKPAVTSVTSRLTCTGGSVLGPKQALNGFKSCLKGMRNLAQPACEHGGSISVTGMCHFGHRTRHYLVAPYLGPGNYPCDDAASSAALLPQLAVAAEATHVRTSQQVLLLSLKI